MSSIFNGYFLGRVLRDLGITPAIKQVIGAENIVQNTIINRKTKARKILDNFSLSGNPQKAEQQMLDVMNAIEIDYLGHKGNKRKIQASSYFLDDISELHSWMKIIERNPSYEKIFPSLKERYNLLMSNLEDNENLVSLMDSFNNTL
jgi:hypothetical protein